MMTIDQILKYFTATANGIILEFVGAIVTSLSTWNTIQTLTYGPSIAIDASAGEQCNVTISNNTAFVVAAPTNHPGAGYTQKLYITFINASGGAHGAGTFNAIFKTAGNVPTIADTKNRTVCFAWNGTNWVEQFRTAADVAN